MENKQYSPIGDSWDDIKKEICENMEELKLKWGYEFHEHESFLLGVNINIGNYGDEGRYGYICFYLGFRTLVIGKDFFE